MVGFATWSRARAATAVPLEGEVAIVVCAELAARIGRPLSAAVGVVGILALVIRAVSSTTALYYMMAVGVESRNYPYIVPVDQGMCFRIAVIVIEEPGDVVHGNLRSGDLSGVDAGLIPVD